MRTLMKSALKPATLENYKKRHRMETQQKNKKKKFE